MHPTSPYIVPTSAVVDYPIGIHTNPDGAWGYDKWMLFQVMSGRHILRSRSGLNAQADKPVAGAPAVCLYLPPTALQSELNLDWETGSYGSLFGAALQSVTSNDSLGGIGREFESLLKNQTLTAEASSTATRLGESLRDTGSAVVADAIFELLGKIIENPQQKIGGILGATPNPRTDIFFSNVQYRTHSFTWKLVPRNLSEAENIDKILNTFQYYSLPSFGHESDGENGFFMGYPYEWSVQMFSEAPGRSKHHINTIDRSVVTRVSINHASSDRVSFIVDGGMKYYPTETQLTIDMKEVRLQGRNDQDVIWRGLATETGRSNSHDAAVREQYPDPNANTLNSLNLTSGGSGRKS